MRKLRRLQKDSDLYLVGSFQPRHFAALRKEAQAYSSFLDARKQYESLKLTVRKSGIKKIRRIKV